MRHAAMRMQRQRGAVIVLVAIVMVALIGALGLAIDTGRAYGVRASLNAAVDAAAIAGARALVEGENDATRIANAEAAALRFFEGNFASRLHGATPSAPTTSVVREDGGRWRVTVNATADLPTTFARVMRHEEMRVLAVGQTIRRELDAMLVLDTSGSLNPPTSPAGTFAALQAAAINGFVNKFPSGPGGDRIGLVSFASGAVIDQPIDRTATRGFDKNAIVTKINALAAGGYTASAEGMRLAYNELNAVPEALRSSLRVILFFSDGAPNTVPAQFLSLGNGLVNGTLAGLGNPSTSPATALHQHNARNTLLGYYGDIATLPTHGLGNIPLASYNNRRTLTGNPVVNSICNTNRAARNMVENVANIARSDGIVVYTVGLGALLNALEIGTCGYGVNEWGSNILRRLANTTDSDTHNPAQPTGLFCHALDMTQLERCFSSIASEILRLTL